MSPEKEQPKSKEPVVNRRSIRLAKKRRTNTPKEDGQAPQQDIEESDVKTELTSEDEVPLAGKSYHLSFL